MWINIGGGNLLIGCVDIHDDGDNDDDSSGDDDDNGLCNHGRVFNRANAIKSFVAT